MLETPGEPPATRDTPASRAKGGLLVVGSFVVLLFAWLIAGEAIHPYHVLAAVVVIGGVYLTTR